LLFQKICTAFNNKPNIFNIILFVFKPSKLNQKYGPDITLYSGISLTFINDNKQYVEFAYDAITG